MVSGNQQVINFKLSDLYILNFMHYRVRKKVVPFCQEESGYNEQKCASRYQEN